jgi:CheY-like chemotaxis protein
MPKVLVVNDADQTRPITAHFLERMGYSVDIAADGAEVLDLIRGTLYDAIVLDVIMPRVDGHGVLVHLARTNPTMIGRTVLVAAFQHEATDEGLDEVCRVLVKPVAVGELVDAINECVAA